MHFPYINIQWLLVLALLTPLSSQAGEGVLDHLFGREAPSERPIETKDPGVPLKATPAPQLFRPGTREFDLNQASIMAWLSYIAYYKRPDGTPDMERIRSELAPWGPIQVEPIDAHPVQGFIIKGRGFAVVVFRGSDERDDWLDNFEAMYIGNTKHVGLGRPAQLRHQKMIKEPKHDLHAGFYQQFTKAHDGVLSQLKGYEKSKVWFTGHSLGGALTTIFARDFHARHGFEDVGVYTFGAPRPGSRNLANYFVDNKIPAYRVEFGADPVPTLPDLIRFRPVGELIHIKENKNGECVQVQESNAMARYRTLKTHLSAAFNASDHSMGNYVNCLMAIPRQ